MSFETAKKIVLFSTRKLGNNGLFKEDFPRSDGFYAFFKEEIEKNFEKELKAKKAATVKHSDISEEDDIETKTMKFLLEIVGEETAKLFHINNPEHWDYILKIIQDESQKIFFSQLREEYENSCPHEEEEDTNDKKGILKEVIKDAQIKNEGDYNIEGPNSYDMNNFECRFKIYSFFKDEENDYAAFSVWPLKYCRGKKEWISVLIEEVNTWCSQCEEVLLILHDKDIETKGTPFRVIEKKDYSLQGNRKIKYTLCLFQHSSTDPINRVLDNYFVENSDTHTPKTLFEDIERICSIAYSMKKVCEEQMTKSAYEKAIGLITSKAQGT